MPIGRSVVTFVLAKARKPFSTLRSCTPRGRSLFHFNLAKAQEDLCRKVFRFGLAKARQVLLALGRRTQWSRSVFLIGQANACQPAVAGAGVLNTSGRTVFLFGLAKAHEL